MRTAPLLLAALVCLATSVALVGAVASGQRAGHRVPVRVVRVGDQEEAGETFTVRQLEVKAESDPLLERDPTPTDDASLIINAPNYDDEDRYSGMPRFVAAPPCNCGDADAALEQDAPQKEHVLPSTQSVILQAKEGGNPALKQVQPDVRTNMDSGVLDNELVMKDKQTLKEQQKVLLDAVFKIRTLERAALVRINDPESKTPIPQLVGKPGDQCVCPNKKNGKQNATAAATPAAKSSTPIYNEAQKLLGPLAKQDPELAAFANPDSPVAPTSVAGNAHKGAGKPAPPGLFHKPGATPPPAGKSAEELEREKKRKQQLAQELLDVERQILAIEHDALAKIADLRLRNAYEKDQLRLKHKEEREKAASRV